MSHGLHRVVCDLTGIVQGVGFRPAVYRLARRAGLGGHVQNRLGSVRLTLLGPLERIREFLAALPGALPPNARIDSSLLLEETVLPDGDAAGVFTILESGGEEPAESLIPADLAACPDCLREVFDPADRRYGYPFTTCTRCGPRYTVINAMPYDRVRTTLAPFELCGECRREYDNPEDRRFHAESVACSRCGPRLFLEKGNGRPAEGDALRQARKALSEGAVVAVRGLGGFLLAADARNSETLRRLRARKNRPHKPFAVMARDVKVLRATGLLDPAMESLLATAAGPIGILDVPPGAAIRRLLLFELIAPDTATLGVMLPTTPLHALLAAPLKGDPVEPFDWLIMTSGNRGGEPVCISNEEARARLGGIADYLLVHDREINLRNDDSICVIRRGKPQVWRRARGYAPNAVRLGRGLSRCVLAMGAELKNTLAVGFGDRVVLSPHVGDLEAPEAVDALRQVAALLPLFVNRAPEVIAVDLHPDMQSSRLGREIAKDSGVPIVEVQHHHAHGAAGLGEHGFSEGLALVFDGTGLGADGHLWGAELLRIEPGAFQRLASFAGAPLPGGDAAVRRPARQVAGRCFAAGLALPPALRDRLGVSEEELQVWLRQCAVGLNTPVTHAAGRLFDSFSAALGCASATATYEGQSAIRLEAAARRHPAGRGAPALGYRAEERDALLWIDWREAFARLLECGAGDGAETDAWAYAAHVAIAEAALEMVRYGIDRTGSGTVSLSGGVFMNGLLNDLLVPRLESLGVKVLLHRETPPNDGCIALGQAIVAGS